MGSHYSSRDVAVTFVVGVIVACCAVYAVQHKPSQPDYTVLVCSDELKSVRVVGISSNLSLVDGIYWLNDSHGNRQSYNKSSWEWCATMSLQDAIDKELVAK